MRTVLLELRLGDLHLAVPSYGTAVMPVSYTHLTLPTILRV